MSSWSLLFYGAQTLKEAGKTGWETQGAPARPSLVAQKPAESENLFLAYRGPPLLAWLEFDGRRSRKQAKTPW